MGKGKTKKSITKRFRITKNKKVLYRPMHQNHFNSKDNGEETCRKRKPKQLNKGIKNKVLKRIK